MTNAAPPCSVTNAISIRGPRTIRASSRCAPAAAAQPEAARMSGEEEEGYDSAPSVGAAPSPEGGIGHYVAPGIEFEPPSSPTVAAAGEVRTDRDKKRAKRFNAKLASVVRTAVREKMEEGVVPDREAFKQVFRHLYRKILEKERKAGTTKMSNEVTKKATKYVAARVQAAVELAARGELDKARKRAKGKRKGGEVRGSRKRPSSRRRGDKAKRVRSEGDESSAAAAAAAAAGAAAPAAAPSSS